MPKTDSGMNGSDVYKIVNLLRGGLPFKGATVALGLDSEHARKELKKKGIKAMGYRSVSKRHKDTDVHKLYEAIRLALGLATPEVIYLVTGVTIRQVINRWGEMDSSEAELLSFDQEQTIVAA